jgi:hypothetical protein
MEELAIAGFEAIATIVKAIEAAKADPTTTAGALLKISAAKAVLDGNAAAFAANDAAAHKNLADRLKP